MHKTATRIVQVDDECKHASYLKEYKILNLFLILKESVYSACAVYESLKKFIFMLNIQVYFCFYRYLNTDTMFVSHCPI